MTQATTTAAVGSVSQALAAAQRIVHLVSGDDFPVAIVLSDTRLRVTLTTAHLIAAAAHENGAYLLAAYHVARDTDATDRYRWGAALQQLAVTFADAGIEVTY